MVFCIRVRYNLILGWFILAHLSYTKL